MTDYETGYREASCLIGILPRDALILMGQEQDTDYNRGWLDALTQTTD